MSFRDASVNEVGMILIFFSFLPLFFIGCAHLPKDNIQVKIYPIQNSPLIGLSDSAQTIYLGGFSSLSFVIQQDGLLIFETITDRGPNGGENTSGLRPFLLPDFAPQLVRLGLDIKSGDVKVISTTPFQKSQREKMSGLPPVALPGQKAERASDIFNKPIRGSFDGMDSEGFCRTGDRIAVAEEYGPDLLLFSQELVLQKRLRPGQGLPLELAQRKNNRGFEALACNNNRAYVMLQSPLKTQEQIDKNHIRLLQLDLENTALTEQYYYPVDETRADKIGDMAWLPDGSLLVIEQNGVLGASGIRRIYRVTPHPSADRTLKKELLLDLASLGINDFEKLEGLAAVDAHTLAVIMDNDFGLSGDVESSTGLALFKNDTKSYLVLIHLKKPLF